VAGDLEELVQPRGAVDGDGLARQVAVAGLGWLQELVELGSHIPNGRWGYINENIPFVLHYLASRIEVTRRLCLRSMMLYIPMNTAPKTSIATIKNDIITGKSNCKLLVYCKI
jgi:hypothetical protein